jgi:hypothetical protein
MPMQTIIPKVDPPVKPVTMKPIIAIAKPKPKEESSEYSSLSSTYSSSIFEEEESLPDVKSFITTKSIKTRQTDSIVKVRNSIIKELEEHKTVLIEMKFAEDDEDPNMLRIDGKSKYKKLKLKKYTEGLTTLKKAKELFKLFGGQFDETKKQNPTIKPVKIIALGDKQYDDLNKLLTFGQGFLTTLSITFM